MEKVLESIGLVYKRTEGNHEVWDYPDDSLNLFKGAIHII
jgi:hypothetical protein